jgi:hypothetical protein
LGNNLSMHGSRMREFVSNTRNVGSKLSSRLRFIAVAATLVALGVGTSGCVNGSLAAARGEIKAGRYASAHQYLIAAEHSEAKLSAREQREVADDLCLTEYRIGAPSYPLAEQARVCSTGAGRPGSQSAAILVEVQQAERTALATEIETALASKDTAQAEAAIVRYEDLPGSDPQAAQRWSKQLWALVNRDSATGRHDRHLAPIISEISRQYPQLRAMNEGAFRRWVEDKTTVSGMSMVSSVEVSKGVLRLWIPNTQMRTAALNLDRFADINDALVARCHCNGKTNIAAQDSGLPAYLVRLDPETRRSEVLILARP